MIDLGVDMKHVKNLIAIVSLLVSAALLYTAYYFDVIDSQIYWIAIIILLIVFAAVNFLILRKDGD